MCFHNVSKRGNIYCGANLSSPLHDITVHLFRNGNKPGETGRLELKVPQSVAKQLVPACFGSFLKQEKLGGLGGRGREKNSPEK